MAMLYSHPSRMAAYNTWANARLYDAATALTDFERKRDVKAYFTSLHGTLNHLLTADRIWLKRLTGEGDAPDKLGTVLFEQFSELREAREVEDKRLMDYAATVQPDQLETILEYVNTRGEEKALPLGVVLTHLFNHQTHHRGQVHAMLTAAGSTAPVSDLFLMPGEP